MPSSFEDQVRQALSHIKAILETAGLTMDNVAAYTQLYLEDISKNDQMNSVFRE